MFQTLLAGLDSKDWVVVCESLNNVRRLSIFHKEALLDMLWVSKLLLDLINRALVFKQIYPSFFFSIMDPFLWSNATNRGDVIPLIVKSLKNPRSAVCKTAIMTSADFFSAYNDQLIDSLDPLVLSFNNSFYLIFLS